MAKMRWLGLLCGLLLTEGVRADIGVAEQELRLGTLRSGLPHTHRITLTNIGKQPIELVSVRAGCGCVKPRLQPQVLPPGAQALLLLDMHTLGEAAGPHHWQVFVRYLRGGVPHERILKLSANLVTEVTVLPSSLTMHVGTSARHELRLTDLRQQALHVTSVHTTSPYLQAQLGRVERTPQGYIQATIHLVTDPRFPAGRHEEQVAIYTDDLLYRQLTVPIVIHKASAQRVTATPAQVYRRAAPGEALATQVLLLRDSAGSQVVLGKLYADHPAVQARWASAGDGSAAVRVLLDRNQIRGPVLETVLRIDVEQPVRQTLVIPVRCDLE